jgi:hypothetical protein
MMLTLTPEQQQAIAVAGSLEPIEVVGAAGQGSYVLVRGAVHERFRALLAADEFQPAEAYPHMDLIAAREGWLDPEMDAYDQLDPRNAP